MKDDKGYTKEAYKYRAFCNGTEIPYCYTADEEEGFAQAYAVDDEETLIVDGDTISDKIYQGKIEIREIA
jgi:hypothetical protein